MVFIFPNADVREAGIRVFRASSAQGDAARFLNWNKTNHSALNRIGRGNVDHIIGGSRNGSGGRAWMLANRTRVPHTIVYLAATISGS